MISLADDLISAIKPGGWLVQSGILQNQVDQVRPAYSRTLELVSEQVLNGWVRLVWRRPGWV